ncbi:hypothetical protein GNI_098020 [Gregarina niphandrodes]|uniref:Uncharacterized protein n=1 Tax=Gregarina niphandrodes TaxID=110365 RepID=A0A023B4R9_GRENI|nr:hypothetical protein GNI_098020 [Gregarina niphandrodes]EZG57338.1 hypothetical protein GNI_098020 [Gregarina niphandrodes]|eukprot:XP_011131055.1 hypothetical protein GNI_098020 [Gregarina niphandrodes]
MAHAESCIDNNQLWNTRNFPAAGGAVAGEGRPMESGALGAGQTMDDRALFGQMLSDQTLSDQQRCLGERQSREVQSGILSNGYSSSSSEDDDARQSRRDMPGPGDDQISSSSGGLIVGGNSTGSSLSSSSSAGAHPRRSALKGTTAGPQVLKKLRFAEDLNQIHEIPATVLVSRTPIAMPTSAALSAGVAAGVASDTDAALESSFGEEPPSWLLGAAVRNLPGANAVTEYEIMEPQDVLKELGAGTSGLGIPGLDAAGDGLNGESEQGKENIQSGAMAVEPVAMESPAGEKLHHIMQLECREVSSPVGEAAVVITSGGFHDSLEEAFRMFEAEIQESERKQDGGAIDLYQRQLNHAIRKTTAVDDQDLHLLRAAAVAMTNSSTRLPDHEMHADLSPVDLEALDLEILHDQSIIGP